MADDPIAQLRLSLMQDLLPVGLAVVKRAKNGGPSKVAEVFGSSSQPLKDLRSEGESEASIVRERLDQISPGLGNPVMPVTVEIDNDAEDLSQSRELKEEHQQLIVVLNQINSRLDLLDQYLQEDVKNTTST